MASPSLADWHSRRTSATALLSAILVAAACSDSASQQTGTYQDSAGIRIVRVGPLSDETGYGTELVYEFRGAPDSHLWERVEAGVLLADGHAAVADVGASEVVFLDGTGAVTAVVGGRGSGPGEIRHIGSMLLSPPDTVLVMDGANARITTYHRDSPPGNQRMADPAVFQAMRAIGSVNGDLILMTARYSPFTSATWVRAVLARYARSDGSMDTLLVFDFQPGVIRGETPNPFRAQGYAAGEKSGFATSRADRTQFESFDNRGTLTQIVRWTEEARPMDEHTWREYEDYARTRQPASPQYDQVLSNLRGAAHGPLPHTGSIRIDDVGNVWVGVYAPDPRYLPRYRVFSPAGEFKGWVDIPPRTEVLDIAHGFLLAVHRDEYDVPAIRVYRLTDREAAA